MKIKYEFVTGEIVEIEVSDSMNEISMDIERMEYNSNRKETSRHSSIESMEDKGLQFGDDTADISDFLEEIEAIENLHMALSQLLPQQKELIQMVFFEERSIVGIAREDGVNEAAVRNRLKKIYKKLKNILD